MGADLDVERFGEAVARVRRDGGAQAGLVGRAAGVELQLQGRGLVQQPEPVADCLPGALTRGGQAKKRAKGFLKKESRASF